MTVNIIGMIYVLGFGRGHISWTIMEAVVKYCIHRTHVVITLQYNVHTRIVVTDDLISIIFPVQYVIHITELSKGVALL